MVITLSKKQLDIVYVGLFLFILIFAPPFMPYPHILLALICFVAVNTKYLYLRDEVLYYSGMSRWIMIIIGLMAYMFTLPILVSSAVGDVLPFSHYLTVFNRFFVLVITVVPCSCLLICIMIEKKCDVNFLFEAIIFAGLIEAGCSILAYLSPRIKSYFIELMRNNTDSMLYRNEWFITVRSYGFSRTLVDLFGLGMALIAVICLIYGVQYRFRYIIASFLAVFSAALNARTGVVIYLMAFMAAMVYLLIKRNYAKFLKISFIAILLFVAAKRILIFYSANETATSSWLISGLESVMNFISRRELNIGGNDAVSNLITRNSWLLPEGVRLFIGTGHSLYGAQGYTHSDIGYINDIWIFGVLGALILYGAVIWLCINVNRKSGTLQISFFAIACAISFLVFNFKGTAFSYNPGMVVILTPLFVCNYFLSTKSYV